MMTRDEHLAWCKQRALEYADAGALPQAVASMISDLGKWDGGELYTASAIAQLGAAGMFGYRTMADVRRWIEGFN